MRHAKPAAATCQKDIGRAGMIDAPTFRLKIEELLERIESCCKTSEMLLNI